MQRVLASRSMDLTSQWRRSVAATSVSETWHRFVTSINVYAIRRGSFVWNARETIKFIDPSYPSNPFRERKYKRYDAFSRFMFVSSRFFFFISCSISCSKKNLAIFHENIRRIGFPFLSIDKKDRQTFRSIISNDLRFVYLIFEYWSNLYSPLEVSSSSSSSS